MANETKWIVTTSSYRPIQDIAQDLADAGLENIQILHEIGIVTGSKDESIEEKLRKVPGVKDVSRDTSIEIGPPNSEKSW